MTDNVFPDDYQPAKPVTEGLVGAWVFDESEEPVYNYSINDSARYEIWWDRVLSPDEIRALAKDPYAIFRPHKPRGWLRRTLAAIWRWAWRRENAE